MAYKIGDIGPGGGLVFYIDSNKHIECSEILGKANWGDAIALAENYQGGGDDHWYLPTMDNLTSMYQNLRCNGFISDDDRLWSSSDYYAIGSSEALRFSDGDRGTYFPKSHVYTVRAIKYFYI